MLQIKDLYYSIGGYELLSGIDWAIQAGKRVALIGPNGAGKTTLFRIISGEIEFHRGSINKSKSYRIGYLPQEEISLTGGSVLQTVLEGKRDVAALEKKIAELFKSLNSTHAKLLKKLGTLELRYETLGGYRLEVSAKSVLSGLGFSENDFSSRLSDLSGGWRMRVYLARLLVQEPDLLLLDEPTNHLDLPALEWLEQYLLHFSGSIVIVSHDRFFIERLAHEIYELDRGKLEHYAGNYHFYERQKEQREIQLRKKWEEQKAEKERQERFIRRFRYKATKASQVQSRIKLLERMEKIALPPPPRRFGFELSVETPSYRDVLKIENMSFRYGKEWILKNINFHLSRGEKVAMVGVNGAGKTTLSRLVAQQLSPQEGVIQIGKRTTIGYYAQHQAASLDLNATIYDEVSLTAASCHIPRIRDVLGIFQFSGDSVLKRIEVLSGGEKARVSLAKILLSPINFLIMDEPTNHLDMISIEALEKALEQYNGTLLLISHDRYFLDKLVSRVVEIKEGQIREYFGNYSYYMEKRKEEPKDISEAEAIAEPKISPQKKRSTRKSKEQKRLEAEARQTVSKERNRLEKEIESLEATIEELEAKKSDIEIRLVRPDTHQDGELVVSLQKEYAAVKQGIENSYERWEKARIKLEEIINKISKVGNHRYEK